MTRNRGLLATAARRGLSGHLATTTRGIGSLPVPGGAVNDEEGAHRPAAMIEARKCPMPVWHAPGFKNGAILAGEGAAKPLALEPRVRNRFSSETGRFRP